MAVKITKKHFIEAIENNEDGLTNKELAAKLQISEVYFYKLKERYKSELRDAAEELIKKNALEIVRDLLAQSHAGKTQATIAALEMLKIKRQGGLVVDDSNENSWKIVIEKNYEDNPDNNNAND